MSGRTSLIVLVSLAGGLAVTTQLTNVLPLLVAAPVGFATGAGLVGLFALLHADLDDRPALRRRVDRVLQGALATGFCLLGVAGFYAGEVTVSGSGLLLVIGLLFTALVRL